MPLTVTASVVSIYAFRLYREMSHSVGQQKYTQRVLSGEPSRDDYVGANKGGQDYVPLQDIEVEEYRSG